MKGLLLCCVILAFTLGIGCQKKEDSPAAASSDTTGQLAPEKANCGSASCIQ